VIDGEISFSFRPHLQVQGPMAGPSAGMKLSTTSDLHHVETAVPVDGPTDLRLITASRTALHGETNEEAAYYPPGRYTGRSRR
jgi:hypothetical protein